ncbi:DUF4261 domain-containing protein [Gordonia malaquae]|uniref:DUF4261 domain-containing protein n=1 Tax=Gordonia malaquae TaxID=410332 RepID=UPI00301905D2
MPSLAMLFQDRLDPAVDGPRLRAQLLADFPDLDASILTVDPSEGDDAPLTLSYGDTMIALMGIPAAASDNLPEIAQYSRLWPDTAPVPGTHDAHTIVTVLRPGQDTNHRHAIADAVLLSKVIASTIALTDTVIAVYFGSADHVILPSLFRELAIETLPEPILPAWVALNVAPRTDGVMTGHTMGLDMLGLKDIEIPESPETAEETFARLANIAIYLLQNGPVIGDGDTLGSTADAEVVAHHVPSVVIEGKEVMQLTFGDAEPAAPVVAEPEHKKRSWFRRK